mmetsp:Transcript_19617/g.41233  ORF Transcript_19617/g.41233 Transcript_19617/m.41233 type:complete len:82 (+) Transcript_19617:114-359(+)
MSDMGFSDCFVAKWEGEKLFLVKFELDKAFILKSFDFDEYCGVLNRFERNLFRLLFTEIGVLMRDALGLEVLTGLFLLATW